MLVYLLSAIMVVEICTAIRMSYLLADVSANIDTSANTDTSERIKRKIEILENIFISIYILLYLSFGVSQILN
jgi:hypothetical protein